MKVITEPTASICVPRALAFSAAAAVLLFASAQAGARSSYSIQKPPSDDIRELAPTRPNGFTENVAMLVAPRPGTDLAAMGQDWLTRETHLLTGGADERFLLDLNKRLNSAFTVNATAEPSPARDLAGSFSDNDRNGTKTLQSVRFTSINRLEFALANSSNLSCSVSGSNMSWDLSHQISESMGLNLRHEPSSNLSSFRLRYNW